MSQENPNQQTTESGQPVSQESSLPGSGEIAVGYGNNTTTIIAQVQDDEAPGLPIVLCNPQPPVVHQPPQVLMITHIT